MVKGTIASEKDDQHKRGEVPLCVQVCEEKIIKGKRSLSG